MTDRAARIALATRLGVANVAAISTASDEVGVPFAIALALVEKESGGQNIYGHDSGGALSTNGRSITVCGTTYPSGADIPVTPANAGVFLLKIAAGERSNGMGPCQITYAGDLPDGRTGGHFRLMLEEGLLPWEPLDNLRYGLDRLADQLTAGLTIAEAGTVYNAGNLGGGVNDYGRDLEARVKTWRRRFKEAGI